MADPSLFDFMRIPTDALIALDDRTLHFAMQRWHYLIRLSHVVTMGAFFGAIGLVDLRLMGWRKSVPLARDVQAALPWMYAMFGCTVVTGLALFLYDPVHVGSHAYFAPKLALIVLGLGNALLFHWTGFRRVQSDDGVLPLTVRAAGAVSIGLWTAVIICSSMNVEGIPKVFLR